MQVVVRILLKVFQTFFHAHKSCLFYWVLTAMRVKEVFPTPRRKRIYKSMTIISSNQLVVIIEV